MTTCRYQGNDAPEGCKRQALKGWTTCARHKTAGRTTKVRTVPRRAKGQQA